MIANDTKMEWCGHRLYFLSETSPCEGCFFSDKDSCPDCDEGIWVEEKPSLWHTGTPTEEGWYVCKLRGVDIYETENYIGNEWGGYIEKWQKIDDEEN